MKKLLLVFMVITCPVLYAGDSSNFNINCFDRQTNRHYFGITVSPDDSEVINVCVYNSIDNSTVYIFPKTNKDIIIDFIFQVGYSSKNMEMVTNFFGNQCDGCEDSGQIDYQKASKNILIITSSEKDGMRHLYICSKTGENLKELKRFDEETLYKIDALNSKIILYRQTGKTLDVESFSF